MSTVIDLRGKSLLRLADFSPRRSPTSSISRPS